MLLASDLVSVFERLSKSLGDQMGVVFQNAVMAFLESSKGGRLADLRRFLIEPSFREKFPATVTDPDIVYFWRKDFTLLSGNRSIGPFFTRLQMKKPNLSKHRPRPPMPLRPPRQTPMSPSIRKPRHSLFPNSKRWPTPSNRSGMFRAPTRGSMSSWSGESFGSPARSTAQTRWRTRSETSRNASTLDSSEPSWFAIAFKSSDTSANGSRKPRRKATPCSSPPPNSF